MHADPTLNLLRYNMLFTYITEPWETPLHTEKMNYLE